jgi:hypothetical protein
MSIGKLLALMIIAGVSGFAMGWFIASFLDVTGAL